MTAKTKSRWMSAISISLATIGVGSQLLLGTRWVAPCVVMLVVCIAIAVNVEWIWRQTDKRLEEQRLYKLRLDAYGPCKRCLEPAAYLGAIYCGAECTARAEAGI